MINAPVFAVSTPEAFYEMLRAHGSKDPNATAAFAAAHPEFGAFDDWANHPALRILYVNTFKRVDG